MRGLLLVLFVAAVAEAQPKPVGAFSPEGSPAWMSFGSLADFASDESLRAAADRCHREGFRWIAQVGYAENPTTPIGPHAARVKARFDRLGLSPCIVAMTVGEEWYEGWGAGSLAPYGLPPTMPWMDAIRIIHAWMGEQHAAAKAATGWPVIWLTSWASVYRPIPAYTDLVALDAYAGCGETWMQSVAPRVLEAEQVTRLPLVLVPQWFIGQDWCEPPADMPAGVAAVLARPQWVAAWGFLWASRPWVGLTGLADMPAVRAAVERALGVS